MTYDQWLKQAQRQHGDKFDPSKLSAKFIPYFNGPRIEVDLGEGNIVRGTVNVSTGYQPVFLLIKRSSDSGSSTILDDDVEILGVVRR